jgi:hypothetical protein
VTPENIEGDQAALDGVSDEFANRLDAEDLADISAAQVQAFETAAVAREREALRECFLERVAILAEAGVAEAELEAARLTAVFARNARFLWVSLRSAFEGRPELLAQLPEGRGQVDALPLGMATVAVRRCAGMARCRH